MEKKLITEMKFMMERLENPRMTYTEYEKKHNRLIKESGWWTDDGKGGIKTADHSRELKHDWEDEWSANIPDGTKNTLKKVTGGEPELIYDSSSNNQIYVIVKKGGVYHLWTYADTAANAQEYNKTFDDIESAKKVVD